MLLVLKKNVSVAPNSLCFHSIAVIHYFSFQSHLASHHLKSYLPQVNPQH